MKFFVLGFDGGFFVVVCGAFNKGQGYVVCYAAWFSSSLWRAAIAKKNYRSLIVSLLVSTDRF